MARLRLAWMVGAACAVIGIGAAAGEEAATRPGSAAPESQGRAEPVRALPEGQAEPVRALPEGQAEPVRALPEGQTDAELRRYLHRLVPELEVPATAEAWTAEADELRRRVLEEVVFRGVPAAWRDGPTQAVWDEVIDADGYRIRKLRYEAVPGLWIGGLLYEPTALDAKVPAVLNVNGHVGEPGMSIDYKQIRCINLAKRGMLALNLEWLGMGQLRQPGYHHQHLAYLDLAGRAGLSVFYLAMRRGLDLLCEHPNADLERVAITGLSGGGWQTIVLSSLDTRVRLTAPNAGYIGLDMRIDHQPDMGDLEQNPTDLVAIADYVHLTAMLAPRPALLIYNAKDECCFPAERARASVYEPVVPVYELFGLRERFALHVNDEPGTHNYELDNRQTFYRFLNAHFVEPDQRIDEEIAVESEVRTQEELAIDYPDEQADFFSLAAEAMASLPEKKLPGVEGAALADWRQEARAALDQAVRPDPRFSLERKEILLSTETRAVGRLSMSLGRLELGRTWTVPLITYASRKREVTGTTLIIDDRGWSSASDVVEEVLARGERAVCLDLLLLGECRPRDAGAAQYAMMIGTLGRRPLGIQVTQFDAVCERLRSDYPDEPLHVITRGRMGGLAALAAAALSPGQLDRLELRDMDISLKELLERRVDYNTAPSLFCFGLLKVVDVPEMIVLAEPARVELYTPEALWP